MTWLMIHYHAICSPRVCIAHNFHFTSRGKSRKYDLCVASKTLVKHIMLHALHIMLHALKTNVAYVICYVCRIEGTAMEFSSIILIAKCFTQAEKR